MGPAKYRIFGESVRKLCPRWRLGEMFGPSEKLLPPEKSLHGSMSRLTGYRIAQPQRNPASVRLGKLLRFQREDVEEFLTRQAQR